MKSLRDPTKLKPFPDGDDILQVIVETPARSRNKYVWFLRGSKMVEQASQLAGDGYHRLVLRLLAASRREVKPPRSQCRVSTVWSQDVVGALDQQA
jgi:hypothetical protein